MRHPRRSPGVAVRRPIVTLTTDFGIRDAYVAVMKASLLRYCPDARLIDVTHQVPAQDVLCGSITLQRAVDGFLPGTIHLAIVDPGVGGDRRMLIVEVNDQFVICPDNGLITWSWRLHPGANANELTWRPTSRISSTFHGRDIFAPAAGLLAAGESLAKLSKPISDPVLLDVAPAEPKARRGAVIHLDHFGNATTNIEYAAVRVDQPKRIRIKGKDVGALQRTYIDVEPGKPLALIGSSGLLEIAVRDGSAQKALRIKVGDEVVLK